MAAVMIYVQHLLGIGHLMRARLIAEALTDIGFDVTLVSGGMAIGGRMPRGVRVVQLPPIRVSDASFMPLRDANFVPIDDAYRAARSEQLIATYESVKPAAVIFETFPFGRRSLRFELMPLLERIAAANTSPREAGSPRPLVIGSVRDILQVQPKVEREREMLVWAKTWFDAILVHADPRFVKFEETFPLLPELGPPIRYTGFVLAPGDRLPIGSGAEDDRPEVVVSAGGGGVGIDLLALALAAQPKSRFGHLTWRVLAGPNIPDAGFERNSALQPSQNLRILSSRFSGIRSDGANNLDLAIIKNTRLREGVQFQLRFEAINALNHPQFNPPNTTPSSSAFGQVTETWASPRTVLFAAKILF